MKKKKLLIITGLTGFIGTSLLNNKLFLENFEILNHLRKLLIRYVGLMNQVILQLHLVRSMMHLKTCAPLLTPAMAVTRRG